MHGTFFLCGCFIPQNIIVIDMRVIFHGDLQNFRIRRGNSRIDTPIMY